MILLARPVVSDFIWPCAMALLNAKTSGMSQSLRRQLFGLSRVLFTQPARGQKHRVLVVCRHLFENTRVDSVICGLRNYF